MNSFQTFLTSNKQKLISILFFCILTTVVITYFQDFNITVDEPLHRYYGESIVNYYLTLGKDTSYDKLFNLKYYGPFFDMVANITYRAIPSLGVYESIHLMCAIFSIFGLYYLFNITKFWFRDSFSYVIVLVLFLSPFYFISSFNQPKDIPFASLILASSYYLLRISMVQLHRVRWKILIILGIFIGLTNAIRSLGVILYIIISLIFLYQLVFIYKDNILLKKIIKKGIYLFLISFCVLTLFHPFLHKSPIRNYIETLQIFSQFPHSMNYLYWGEIVNSLNTPRTYIPTFLLVKSPEYILIGILFYIFPIAFYSRLKSRNREFKILKRVLFIFVFFLFLLILIKPVLYDPRHILFFFPYFYLLLLYPFRFIYYNIPFGKILIPCYISIGLIYSLYIIKVYHPSQSSYYNTIVSKPLGKQSLFDTNIMNTKYRLAFIGKYFNENSDKNESYTIYNGEENDWIVGLNFVGLDKSLIEVYKKNLPFPINLRQEAITYFLPENLILTSHLDNADFILGEDAHSFKDLIKDKKFNEYHGELDFLNIYQLKH